MSRVLWLLLVTVAAAGVARCFRWWGDYLGRAWTLLFIEYVCLTISEMISRFTTAGALGDLAVIIGNLAGIGGFLLLSRTLHAAGLTYYGSRTRKVVFFLAAAALAGILVLPPIISEINAMRPVVADVSGLVSSIADLITFFLVAPLLLTALSLRGGRLAWVYGFLTAGTVGWMVNQGARNVLTYAGMATAVRTGRMAGFAMACAFLAAAAYTQRIQVSDERNHG